jgi:predicted LPLAT superfamily acyltransferase
MQERGAYWGMRTLATVYRVLGRHICLAAMFPVILYFFRHWRGAAPSIARLSRTCLATPGF